MRASSPHDNIGLALAEALFQAIHRELATLGRPATDLINFSIQAHGFSHAYQTINFSVGEFLERSVRLNELLQTLAGKLNSNESFDHRQQFIVDINFIAVPNPGRGRGHKRDVGRRCLDKDNAEKQCIIPIKNKDNLCCARAIVTMKAHCHRHEDVISACNWNSCRRGLPSQARLARELHADARVPKGACGLPELEAFQSALGPGYQLRVMCRSKPFFLIYKGPEAPHKIRLLKSEHHYDGCTSFPAFVNRSYWCHLCGKGYNTEDAKHHPCEGRTCKSCCRKNCPDYKMGVRATVHCFFCNCRFHGQDCFAHHQANGQCQRYKTCPKCQAEYGVSPGKRHRCGYAKCNSCHELVEVQTHKCFIQPIIPQETSESDDEEDSDTPPPLPPAFVYADIEAMQLPDRSFQANLLCYQLNESDEIVSLKGDDCCLSFLHDMDDLASDTDDDRERPVIIIFHNLKGFDGTFLINELYKQQRPVEDQLTIGAKVLAFTSGPLSFKDSLCFLPMPLTAFTSTFNLTELKKGFFPHIFNTPEHQEYVGPIPTIDYYDPEGMHKAKKHELELWHATQVQNNVVFDFAKELEEYCQSDVALLKGGCEAFSREFESHAGFNPFEKCVTIASACNRYWRIHHLPVDTIAVRPLRGWRGAQVNHSVKALQWLYYCESRIPKVGAAADHILHVRNGGEQSVTTTTDSMFVDGFDPATNTVYEFHGCLWHGCPACFKNGRQTKHNVNPDRTLDELYQATLVKQNALRQAGFNYIEMWECEWDRQVKTDERVKQFLASFELVPPLQPRDAFFGGRTGAVSLYAKAEDGEDILYNDVTSLYPYVNKDRTYPVGHPQIITNPTDQNIHHYFGVALVDILPPEHLSHPVLPVRSGNKLTFPLCDHCVIEEQAKPMHDRSYICTHSDGQRALRGTWCTPEIVKAVEMGYQMLKIHEVWHFPPHQQKAGLFADYVDTWLKIKQEASGWPRWCTDDDKKEQFIRQYEEHEGITLDRTMIQKNPGRKATAKLMLNSFWGKFGERQNKPVTKTCQSPHQLYSYLFDPVFNLNTMRICNEDTLEVVYTHVGENVVASNKTNIFIAAFTTCWARLKLYSYLELLQQQVLYYDTDSVIYRHKPGQPKIDTGDYLGEMTDELDGDVITEFVSGGAKNYGYKTRGGKTECKVRGFTLNARGSAILNYDTMKDNILKKLEEPLETRRALRVTNPNHFTRDTTKKTICLTERVKKYGLVFDKRVITTDKSSKPYGFERMDPEQCNELDILLDLL